FPADLSTTYRAHAASVSPAHPTAPGGDPAHPGSVSSRRYRARCRFRRRLQFQSDVSRRVRRQPKGIPSGPAGATWGFPWVTPDRTPCTRLPPHRLGNGSPPPAGQVLVVYSDLEIIVLRFFCPGAHDGQRFPRNIFGNRSYLLQEGMATMANGRKKRR